MFTNNMTVADATNAIDQLREEVQYLDGKTSGSPGINQRIKIHLCALIEDCEEKIRKIEGVKFVYVVIATRIGAVYEEGKPTFSYMQAFRTQAEAEAFIRANSEKALAHNVAYASQKKKTGAK